MRNGNGAGSWQAGGTPHLRCPVCGLVRGVQWFDEKTVARHELERLERQSLGGRAGFAWECGIELTADDVDALQRCLLVALRRVQGIAAERGLEVVHEDDGESEDDGADEYGGWPGDR